MDTCPIFTAVARDLELDPELLLAGSATPEADAVTPEQQSG